MPNLFFFSDPHFTHANILNFTVDKQGTKLRPGFEDVQQMDELIIARHNAIVRPQDHVYCLGDVAMRRQHLHVVKRLNGHKRLIMGNHDIFEVKEYLAAGFEKVMAIRVMDGLIFTHIPVHEAQLNRFKCNVHGHLHAHNVMSKGWFTNEKDPRYFSVCVEQLNYTPISFDELKQRIQT